MRTYYAQGFGGLYVGLRPTVIKSSIHASFGFAFKDFFMRHAIRIARIAGLDEFGK